MTIKETIDLLESKYIEKAIDKLSRENPKGLLDFWVNVKEFETPKIQRATFEPTTDEDITIKIVYDED